jgi:protein-L-isoaspartate O-methyltransferase
MNWRPHAERLAVRASHSTSRWRAALTETPRHVFVPRWWDHDPVGGFRLRDGLSDEAAWLRTVYDPYTTCVTRVGALHADHANADDRPHGLPTSSSTMPALAVKMYRHGQLHPGADILDVGTGSGYGAALLCRRFGDGHVTTVDVDPYLTEAAAGRLAAIGLHPKVETVDATGPLSGTYDRIVSMVSVWPIPASWPAALRPNGRLVATLANTSLVVTANKIDPGHDDTVEGEPLVAVGRVEHDWVGFMASRHGSDYPPDADEMFAAVRDADGEHVGQGRYPVLNVQDSGELNSMLEITVPGLARHYEQTGDQRTAWLLHKDGSWARASAAGDDPPTVHQSGPRRLWDTLDDLRHYWLTHGYFPLYQARAFIAASGIIQLRRGPWRVTIS